MEKVKVYGIVAIIILAANGNLGCDDSNEDETVDSSDNADTGNSDSGEDKDAGQDNTGGSSDNEMECSDIDAQFAAYDEMNPDAEYFAGPAEIYLDENANSATLYVSWDTKGVYSRYRSQNEDSETLYISIAQGVPASAPKNFDVTITQDNYASPEYPVFLLGTPKHSSPPTTGKVAVSGSLNVEIRPAEFQGKDGTWWDEAVITWSGVELQTAKIDAENKWVITSDEKVPLADSTIIVPAIYACVPETISEDDGIECARLFMSGFCKTYKPDYPIFCTADESVDNEQVLPRCEGL